MSKALEELDIVNQNVALMKKDMETAAADMPSWLISRTNIYWLLQTLVRCFGAIVLAIHENTQVQHQLLKAAEYRNSLLAQPPKE